MSEEKKELKLHIYFPEIDASPEERAMVVKVINHYLGDVND